MDKKPFAPPLPHVTPPSDETIKKLKDTTKRDQQLFLKSDYYRNRVQPTLKRRKEHKRKLRWQWWWSKGIQIVNLILALIAAVTGILGLLR